MKAASSHTKETSATSTLLKKDDQSSFFSYGNTGTNDIQAKLSVGQPHDPYEKEADAMADHVVQKLDAGPSPFESKASHSLQTKPAISLFSSTRPVFTKSATTEHEENLQESKDDEKENVDLKLQRKPIFESNAEPPPPGDDGENNVQRKATDEPSEVDAPAIEQSLSGSKGSGSPLPDETRTQMESSFGADFSGVRIHDDSSSAQMSKDLQAHAFTHGSDIYFNSGKYDVNSKQGHHLLAHELTHVVQQQGPEVKPRVQGAWYNFSIPFTDYEFDPSVEGIKTAAGLTADAAKWTGGKIKEGAVYVKDKAVEAVEWIYEKIKSLVNAGIDWLTDKFMAVKDFAVSAFDSIKSALTGALDLVKSPMEFLKQAFALMNPGFLGTAWTALKSGARMMWQAIKAATDGVLKIGGGIWKTMSGYVDTLFASVGGLINNWLFRKLPDFMQEAARALYEKVKALWQTIRDFWMELWERLTKFVNDLLKSIESFVERVIAYAIDTVINTVKWLRETYDYIQRFIDDPEGTLKPVVDAMVSKIRTEGPPKGDSVRQEKTAEAYAQSQAKKSGANGTIQRAPAGKVERSTASLDEVGEGLIAEMVNQWNTLDFGKLVWEGLKNAVYPPATIKAIGHEFYELWNTDWA
ncbi:MAG: DUF4157 domain-containing protein, partial [Chitinophagaceae bacterium]|nr:DUF4157 domain-containing protein [Chitinophagaceae bacterium]